ncbi:MAG: hypothetical protein KJZ54_06480 [Phycisphaerales bacterium]|nr:hypothetical protein [Phycisphaerales bacterium]
MVGCAVDTSVERVQMGDMRFPLGVYPVEPMQPVQGYTLTFEPSDGDDDEGDWEEWPDRYVFDAVISAERVEPLCRMLFSLMPGRVYPILDVIGRDAYREIDPFVAYDPIPMDRFLDAVRAFRGFFFEDGMCGFGAMSQEPFFYVFVDEHKIVTVRGQADLKEKIEGVLHAFDLAVCEEPAGADAAVHEHRSVVIAPEDRPELLSFDEIVERLRHDWRLVLNIDPDTNVDDDGRDLGVTGWRCIAVARFAGDEPPRYAEILLRAGSLNDAEDLAQDATDDLIDTLEGPECTEAELVASDRLRPEVFKAMAKEAGAKLKGHMTRVGVVSARFL